MFWKKRKKIEKVDTAGGINVTNSNCARNLMNAQVEMYNNSIEYYKDLYIARFYNTWRKSITEQQSGSVEKFNMTFSVLDDFEMRPIESWHMFLDSIISLHPDMQFSIAKRKDRKDRDIITFDYRYCLDDPWLYNDIK